MGDSTYKYVVVVMCGTRSTLCMGCDSTAGGWLLTCHNSDDFGGRAANLFSSCKSCHFRILAVSGATLALHMPANIFATVHNLLIAYISKIL